MVIPLDVKDDEIILSAQKLKAREARRKKRPPEYKDFTPEQKKEYKRKNETFDDDFNKALVQADEIGKVEVPERITKAGILANLGDEEKLYITGHGIGYKTPDGSPSPAIKFGEYDPAQLAEILVKTAGLKKSYRGRIYLQGCNTGTGDEESYARKFQLILADKYHIYPDIKANKGWSHNLTEGQVEVRLLAKEKLGENSEEQKKLLTLESSLDDEIRKLGAEKLRLERELDQKSAEHSAEVKQRLQELESTIAAKKSEKEKAIVRREYLNKISSFLKDKERKLFLKALIPEKDEKCLIM
jgi:hypothetical protein